MRQKSQWFLRLLAAGVLIIGMASVGSAQNNGNNAEGWSNWRGRRHFAPELNPAGGATALALLSGVVLVIRGRRRR